MKEFFAPPIMEIGERYFVQKINFIQADWVKKGDIVMTLENGGFVLDIDASISGELRLLVQEESDIVPNTKLFEIGNGAIGTF